MHAGDRVYNTTSNRSGTLMTEPAPADSGAFDMVAEVLYDAPCNARSYCSTRHLVPESSVK